MVDICRHCGEPVVEYKPGQWTHELAHGERSEFCQTTAAQPLEEN